MKRSHAAFLLPVGMVLSVALLALGYSLSSSAFYQLKLSQAVIRAEQAQAAADGGLVIGQLALAASSTYAGTNGAVTLGAGPATYQITLTKSGGSLGDGRTVPTGCVYMASTGRVGRAARTSAALLRLGNSTPGFKGLRGVLATALTMTNSAATYSYNSLLGWKDSKNGKNGSVATNSSAAGSIRLTNSADIFGPVQLGPGSVVESKRLDVTTGLGYTIWHDWNATVGTTSVMDKPIDLPAAQLPAAGTTDLTLNSQSKGLAPGAYDQVTVANGAKLTLAPGTYVFRTLTLAGGSYLKIDNTGPVKIFVHETLDISNSGDLSDKDDSRPQDLQVYLAPKATLTMQGSASLTGVVYGPGATIKLQNSADIYGAVVGGAVTMQNSARVHYDETLGDFTLADVSGGTGGSTTQTVLFRERY